MRNHGDDQGNQSCRTFKFIKAYHAYGKKINQGPIYQAISKKNVWTYGHDYILLWKDRSCSPSLLDWVANQASPEV